MNRKWFVAICIFLIGFFTAFILNTNAFKNTSDEMPEFTYSSKEKNQVFGYFILDLYHKEIMKAINDYYKKEINGYSTPKPPHYDMVSILATDSGTKFKGLGTKYSYLLKIKLLPSTGTGIVLGEDILYFAVEPNRQNMKNLPKDYPPIELIKYEHIKPPKKEG
ncbi:MULTISPECIES: DUF3888 domain-containing protein [Cytobacillus]|uniref:DUF3888 domain-containing protein n=1 Tax=Cytobacillus TaxID=2675230 RepID=UPI000DEBE7DB|nr:MULTISPECIES: DUF3888 domain-containing protein [Cytobacillus]